MKTQRNIITGVACLFGATFLLTSNAFSQGNSGENANSNNNANANALKWETQGNSADTSHFLGTTNHTALKMRTNNEERMRITEDGNIGIGISNPLQRFEIKGNVRLTGDIIFSGYADTVGAENKILAVDENGKTKAFTKSNLTQYMTRSDCFMYTNGVVTDAPTWASAPGSGAGSVGVLYTGATCPARVGIGTSTPKAKLHIRTNLNSSNEKLFLIERQIGNNDPYGIFQVTNDGLLRAREIKVDQEVWADYVFSPNYELMPLNKVKEFIAQNGHLPNVPTAEEIAKEGLNLGETAKITMEKVEELTLYVIDQQEQLDEQKELLKKQSELIEQQRVLLEEQQQELDTLKTLK